MWEQSDWEGEIELVSLARVTGHGEKALSTCRTVFMDVSKSEYVDVFIVS